MKAYQFHPEALIEADDAALFYQKQQPGFQTRFLEATMLSSLESEEALYFIVELTEKSENAVYLVFRMVSSTVSKKIILRLLRLCTSEDNPAIGSYAFNIHF
jgi:hypothetical protein